MTRTKTLIGVFLSALLMTAVTPASAQTKFTGPAPKIAIVDVQEIMRESLPAKSVRTQMEALARKEQATFAEEEKALRTRDRELQQQRAILTPEVFGERQKALQTDIGLLQRKSRNLRVTLDQAFQRTMDQIQLVLFDELRKLSTELDLNLIMNRSQIVIAVDDFDITKLALERLNKRLPSIELNLTKTENPGQAK